MKQYDKEKFLKKDNDMLARMVSDITGLDLVLLKGNIEIKGKKNKILEEEHTSCDFIVEFDNENNFIVEISKDSFARTLLSNILCILMGIEYHKEEKHNNLKVVQVHFNYEKNCKYAISKYRINDYPNSRQTMLCIEISPDNCKKIYQNDPKQNNIIKWGAYFASNSNEEREKILKDIISCDDK